MSEHYVYKGRYGNVPIELDPEMPSDWVLFENKDGSRGILNWRTSEVRMYSPEEVKKLVAEED